MPREGTLRRPEIARQDFVAQTNNVQCVGASMQMMLNMLTPGGDQSAATRGLCASSRRAGQ
jgi:hypothetical protein